MKTAIFRRLQKRHSDERGLTLIEMIIAVMIFGLISTMVFNLLVTSKDTTEDVQNSSASIAEAQTATTKLDKRIRNAAKLNVPSGGNRLDIENQDGTCTSWVYQNGNLYYKNGGTTAATFAETWTKDITNASLKPGEKFFTKTKKGVEYSFHSGTGIGKKQIASQGFMRLPARETTSSCFGDAGAPAPTPTPTPTAPPLTIYEIAYELKGGLSSTNPSNYTKASSAFTLNNPTRDGYTFAGWTGTELGGPTATVTVAQGSSGNRSYEANWTPVSYSISYDLMGGSASGNPGSYTIETGNFTLNNPTRSGYNFTGWIGTDLASSTNSVTVNKGSMGARSYTATWAGVPTPTPTPTPPPAASSFKGQWDRTGGWWGTVQGDFSYQNNSSSPVNSVKVRLKVPGATGLNGSNLSCSYEGNNEFICVTPSWGSVGPGGWSGKYYAQFTGPGWTGNENPAVQVLSIVKNS